MEDSDSYLVMERMIRQREIELSELGNLLLTLEQQGQITPEEHQTLLALAEEAQTDS